MVPLPPDMLKETGLAEGEEVTLRSHGNSIEIEPAQAPDLAVVEFAKRFTERYRTALARLAQ